MNYNERRYILPGFCINSKPDYLTLKSYVTSYKDTKGFAKAMAQAMVKALVKAMDGYS